MASQVELTPCGAMFDIFKRAAHLSHIELCGLVLSSRPLADGRSPQSRRSLLGFPLYRSRAGRHASAALLCRIRYLGCAYYVATGPAPAQSHGLHGCDQYGVRSCR